ncbi:hypothetical protein FM120_09055 [Sphingobacterium faecium PCAi_F2.5]|nr:hypothetical protein FM120_09055 [Sphingobacterium faecium PCAi_F2.5]
MLSKNQNLLFLIKRSFNSILQFEHYRTRCIDEGYVIFQCDLICLRSLPMCANKYFLVL